MTVYVQNEKGMSKTPVQKSNLNADALHIKEIS